MGEGVVREGYRALVRWMGIEKENLFGKIHVIVPSGYYYMYLSICVAWSPVEPPERLTYVGPLH